MSRLILGCTALLACLGLLPSSAQAQENPMLGTGQLQILGPDGKPAGACPLKHTDVQSDIAGYVGRTTVRQTFHNPLDRKIEAIYAFPLPAETGVCLDTVAPASRQPPPNRIPPCTT